MTLTTHYPTSLISQARTEDDKVRIKHILATFLALLILALVGAMFWLANAPLMPSTQKMELTIPDDRIPR
jgi:ABC-type siderophore export system fused ATPase/permease subunit